MKILVLIFCCLLSLASFWYGVKLIRLYFRVKKWDRVKATVIRKAATVRAQSSASRAGYKASVDYTYNFNSKEYAGNKVFLIELVKGERGFIQRAAEKFLEKIKPEIEIYVNPKNPEEAVIYCDGIILYFGILLMGTMSLIIGLSNYAG
ncbi:MAG: DUF3592 domain-containing protein [Sphingobacteriaceae bacterium]|nr:DUF3592 domain-containing protein [Sphingobacteriaceae bacterium]